MDKEKVLSGEWETLGEMIEGLSRLGFREYLEILEAMGAVDRWFFVPEIVRKLGFTYHNKPLPIGWEQTISQPYLVAKMLLWLDVQPGERVLDVGAGSGWLATLLGYRVQQAEGGLIVAVERIKQLKKRAERSVVACRKVKKGIVKLVWGDGYYGYEASAPFDKIIASASVRVVPEAWKKQLKIGGVIIAPVGPKISDDNDDGSYPHHLKAFVKQGENQWGEFGIADSCRFVPLKRSLSYGR